MGKKTPRKDSSTKDKKPDASKSGGPSEPNTPSQYFMDTEATKKACDKELKLIRKNCTPSPESQKKKGLGAKLGEITDGLDSVGKKLQATCGIKALVHGVGMPGWMRIAKACGLHLSITIRIFLPILKSS